MLTRPPPLQLIYDNTLGPGLRPAPQAQAQTQTQPQPEQPLLLVVESKPTVLEHVGTFAALMYQANWRNFVIAIAAVNALRFIVSAWSFFYDADVDYRSYRLSKLAQISIALGALYLITAFIQIFGVVGAAMQRPTLIRAYVYLAFLAALLITTAGFISGVEYFLLAARKISFRSTSSITDLAHREQEDIISECVTLSLKGSWISKSIFRGPFRHGEIPSTKVAQQQCQTAWSHGSLSQVIGIFMFSVIPALFFFFLVYTYYRQTTDPSHPACLNMKTGEALYVRMEAHPNPSPLYNGDDARQNQSRNDGRGRVETRPIRTRTSRHLVPNHASGAPLLQASPLMRTTGSRDPSPYGVSPGPPSYAPQRPTTYGYGNVWFGGERR